MGKMELRSLRNIQYFYWYIKNNYFMIKIETKKMPNGKWSCFATFDGYDHAFVTDSKEESQQQMSDLLKDRNLEGHGLFMKEIIHAPQENKSSYRWIPPKIDNNPFA